MSSALPPATTGKKPLAEDRRATGTTQEPKVLVVLLVFTLLSVTASSYVALRLTSPLGWVKTQPGLVVSASLVLGLFLPCTFALTSWSGRPLADRVQQLGYIWMGFFSLALVFVFAWDLLRLLSAGLGRVASPLAFLPPDVPNSPVHAAISVAILVLVAGIGVAGLVGCRRPSLLRRVPVILPGLPPAFEGFRILQLSDIHIGASVQRDRVEAIVDACLGVQADLIAFTGDLADGRVPRLAMHAEPLARLQARHGVWFVTGNHDYYSGVDPWCALAEELGMRVLLNESRVLDHDGARLQIAGVTDPVGRFFKPDHSPNVGLARGHAAADFRILLAHQPACAPRAAEAGFQLQLSGHTHGGQFFPHTLLVRCFQRYVAGLYDLGGMKLFVHRGTTWWGPPMRLGSRHEIVLLELTSALR